MTEFTLHVGVVIIRRKLASSWRRTAWGVVAILPSPVELAAGAPIVSSDADDLFYAGACELTLYRSDTSHYRDNLRGDQPMLWVTLAAGGDPPSVTAITANPYEGEALAETESERVEAAPMPPSIAELIARFVEAHHIERPFFKRRRD